MYKNKIVYTTIKGKNKPSAFQYQGKSTDKDKTKVPTADLKIGRHLNQGKSTDKDKTKVPTADLKINKFFCALIS